MFDIKFLGKCAPRWKENFPTNSVSVDGTFSLFPTQQVQATHDDKSLYNSYDFSSFFFFILQQSVYVVYSSTKFSNPILLQLVLHLHFIFASKSDFSETCWRRAWCLFLSVSVCRWYKKPVKEWLIQWRSSNSFLLFTQLIINGRECIKQFIGYCCCYVLHFGCQSSFSVECSYFYTF